MKSMIINEINILKQLAAETETTKDRLYFLNQIVRLVEQAELAGITIKA